jgi:hypothetical protein
VPNKGKLERIERQVDAFCALCEKVTLRMLLFGCFVAEVGRFVLWFIRMIAGG